MLATAAGIVTASALAAAPPSTWRAARPAFLGGCAIGFAGMWLVWQAPAATATPLCCTIDRYRTVLEIARRQATELAAPGSIVAAPDLGKLSFPKQVIIVDLGLLGDPVTTNIDRQRPDLLDDYLDAGADPRRRRCARFMDVLDVPRLGAGPRLRDHLRPRPRQQPWTTHARVPRRGPVPVLPASAPSPGYAAEMALAGDLADDPSRGAQLVVAATATCAAAGTDPWRCQWVRRAIQRATPELRAADTRDEVVDVLAEASPTADLDRLLLETPTDWGADAADLIVEELSGQDDRRSLSRRSCFCAVMHRRRHSGPAANTRPEAPWPMSFGARRGPSV